VPSTPPARRRGVPLLNRRIVGIGGSALGFVLIVLTLPSLVGYLVHGPSDPFAGGVPFAAEPEQQYEGVLGALFRPSRSDMASPSPSASAARSAAPTESPSAGPVIVGGVAEPTTSAFTPTTPQIVDAPQPTRSPTPGTSFCTPVTCPANPGLTPTPGASVPGASASPSTPVPVRSLPGTPSPSPAPSVEPAPTPTQPPTPTPAPTLDPTPAPTPEPTPDPTPDPPTSNCADGIDNDHDLLIDGLDPGCILDGDELSA